MPVVPVNVRIRFVDGPLAGVEREVAARLDGTAPPVMTAPVNDPGLGVPVVVYERVDPAAADGSARYRVAPIAA